MDTVAQLTQLRQSLEQETGVSVADLEINTACVLYDVAKFLQLSRDETRDVVGPDAYRMITTGQRMGCIPQPCPFGYTCLRIECDMEECDRFGDRWAFVKAFGCDHQEAADG